jgi:hypothetical protein
MSATPNGRSGQSLPPALVNAPKGALARGVETAMVLWSSIHHQNQRAPTFAVCSAPEEQHQRRTNSASDRNHLEILRIHDRGVPASTLVTRPVSCQLVREGRPGTLVQRLEDPDRRTIGGAEQLRGARR